MLHSNNQCLTFSYRMIKCCVYIAVSLETFPSSLIHTRPYLPYNIFIISLQLSFLNSVSMLREYASANLVAERASKSREKEFVSTCYAVDRFALTVVVFI